LNNTLTYIYEDTEFRHERSFAVKQAFGVSLHTTFRQSTQYLHLQTLE